MAITDFAVTFELDPAKDGTWSEDITNRVFEASVRRGRTSALERISPGELQLRVSNRDGRFSPDKGVIVGLDNFTPVRVYETWTAPAVTNIIENPSFETDVVSVSGAAIVRDTTESWAGGASVKSTVSDVDGSGMVFNKRDSSRFSVTAGLAYTFAPRTKGPSGKSMEMQISWHNSSGGEVQADIAPFTFGSGWIQLSLTITAPTGAVTARLRLLTDGAQGVFDFFVDAVMFYQGSSLIPYVDGDQPGCTWSGTAHESTSSRGANPVFLLFQGFIFDFDIKQDKLDRTAVLSCYDRLALLAEFPISVGNMLDKLSSLVLHRIVDRFEGELITHFGHEWIGTTARPLTGYSGLGATVSALQITPSANNKALMFEGDWVLDVTTDNVAAGEGDRYDATADIVATGRYRLSRWARMNVGDPDTEFKMRLMRDAVEVASATITLTQSWQRIAFNANLTTLGTNRYIDLISTSQVNVGYFADDLHAVPQEAALGRDFDAGQFTVPLFNAYQEEAGPELADLMDSEPGILFIKAKTLAAGDELTFRDRNSRPAAEIPRIVFGDGDGLLQFGEGMSYVLAGTDRVRRVRASSRGAFRLGAGAIPAWEMSPVRLTTTGEKWQARYRQAIIRASANLKAGLVIEREDINFGVGADIEVTTGAAGSFFVIEGFPYNRASGESVVEKTATLDLPINSSLAVSMPLHETATADMETEAQRLIDKYKNRVIRLALPLNQRNDEVQAYQFDLEINEMVIVRAKFEDHSPGFDKKFWVEGIEHQFGEGGVVKTTVLLEEAV